MSKQHATDLIEDESYTFKFLRHISLLLVEKVSQVDSQE